MPLPQDTTTLLGLLSSWDEFFKQLPTILEKSSQTPLGIAALAIIALAVLAVVFFPSSPSRVKVGVFVGILAFCTFVTNAVLVYASGGHGNSGTHRPTVVKNGSRLIIAGRVLDVDGRGIRGATVTLEGADTAAAHDDTDQFGAFRFPEVAGDPDNMRITVEAAGYRSSDLRLSSADHLAGLRITLDSIRARIPSPVKADRPNTTVSGAVFDTMDRSPIVGATVTLRGITSQIPPAFTDGKGAFRFDVPQIPASGNLRIFVEAPGYEGVDQIVSANSNLSNIDIRLKARAVSKQP
jgi:Carboxypeptidase regulatory-like domain